MNKTIPPEICDRSLYLSEIGTICVLLASPHLSKELKEFWEHDGTFKVMIENLKQRGIVKMNGDNIEVNLQKEEKNMKKIGLFEYDDNFWDEVDYTKDFGNPIFIKYSNYGDEDGGRYQYRIIGELENAELRFFVDLDSDVQLEESCFYTLEEGQEAIKEALESELEDIDNRRELINMRVKLEGLTGNVYSDYDDEVKACLNFWDGKDENELKAFAIGLIRGKQL